MAPQVVGSLLAGRWAAAHTGWCSTLSRDCLLAGGLPFSVFLPRLSTRCAHAVLHCSPVFSVFLAPVPRWIRGRVFACMPVPSAADGRLYLASLLPARLLGAYCPFLPD